MIPLVFDIQRFSIHDGPGIRTVVFLKGCNLECPWCQNPESISHKVELAYYPDKCQNLRDCAMFCPHGAIGFQPNLTINRALCTQCTSCSVSCHAGAIRVIGQHLTPEQIMLEIEKDKDYYQTSGGGVTFSGGEPTLHFDLLFDLLKRCKTQNIHTNIETNGYFSWNQFQQLLPYLDLIYFDIKIADTLLHKKHLHAGNEKIWENIKNLIRANAPVEFRMPLIPDYTATDQNIRSVVIKLKEMGIKKIHLLAYHNMGEAKAERIGSTLPPLGVSSFNNEQWNEMLHYFHEQELETISLR
ncbi:MAG: glycyl-radical enzyme activating protein [Candidatus Competibacteraceae bacterium]|nr:glycyl-radical enzyme activating protein [Candidatus Competibacteraceae bacterium]